MSQCLGYPIPLDEHAVSVSLPTWRDVVNYEEGDAATASAMKLGYPRFKIHAYVDALKNAIKQGLIKGSRSATIYSFANHDCMVLPSFTVASRCKEFLNHASDNSISIEPLGYDDLHVIYYPISLAPNAKAFWQHIGEILSSRQAEAALKHFNVDVHDVTVRYSDTGCRECLSDSYSLDALRRQYGDAACPIDIVKRRIMTILEEPVNDESSITITTSGMAAIYTALRLTRKVLAEEDGSDGDNLEMVVFGFPYLDTLKMMKRVELNPGGCRFFGHGDESDIDRLEDLLKDSSRAASSKRIGAVFTEFPTNPLLKVSNLTRLHGLSQQHGFLLVVDDTIGNFANVDLLHSADVKVDMLCTSLTKIFSGRGDVMAGSLVINSLSSRASQLRAALPHVQPASLYTEDALVLEVNSRDFIHRSETIMRNATALALWLCDRPEVDYLYYPHPEVIDKQKNRSSSSSSSSSSSRIAATIDPVSLYPSLLRNPAAGYGCLLSIVLKEDRDEKKFFDALDFNKGPSLGTNCTLVCPYTLLAHYTELEWALSYGVDKRLVRVSVGLEDIDIIIDKFNTALGGI